jgi:hypothetical protein
MSTHPTPDIAARLARLQDVLRDVLLLATDGHPTRMLRNLGTRRFD